LIGAKIYNVHPTPYTLHPTSYTPHPTPHTLNPTPYTLHPKQQVQASIGANTYVITGNSENKNLQDLLPGSTKK
jgi:hypothetical protein